MANLAALLAEEQDRLDQLLAASREADDGAERALTDFLGEQESGPLSTGARS
jgi:hypothetical protein